MKKAYVAGLLTFISAMTPLLAKTIGETSALIPEAGLSKETITDGMSGNTNLTQFKSIQLPQLCPIEDRHSR